MTESFKQMLTEIGMTEADWKKHRTESELRLKEFIWIENMINGIIL